LAKGESVLLQLMAITSSLFSPTIQQIQQRSDTPDVTLLKLLGERRECIIIIAADGNFVLVIFSDNSADPATI
jgi:2-polyprenyl-6-methoxyphenol hydroxylase-like FAD-dependent oxidoreductase